MGNAGSSSVCITQQGIVLLSVLLILQGELFRMFVCQGFDELHDMSVTLGYKVTFSVRLVVFLYRAEKT